MRTQLQTYIDLGLVEVTPGQTNIDLENPPFKDIFHHKHKPLLFHIYLSLLQGMYSRYRKHEKRAPPSSTKVARAQRRGSHEGGPAGFAFGWFTVATFDYHEVLLFGYNCYIIMLFPMLLVILCYSSTWITIIDHHWISMKTIIRMVVLSVWLSLEYVWLLPISCPNHPFHIWGSRQDLDDLQAMLHSLGQPGNLTKAPGEKVLPWLIPVKDRFLWKQVPQSPIFHHARFADKWI